jgi:membrane-bound ClpP family serine protease
LDFIMYLVWAILLFALGMGLACLEVFFPSAGILGFLSACSIVAAIVVGFQGGTGVGMAFFVAAVIGMPLLVIAAFRVWPRTAMGRRVMLMGPTSDDVLPDEVERQYLKSLIDKTGTAKCVMMPGGVVAIDGRSVEAVSEGVPVESGQRVRVIAIRGNRVVVRLLEDETPSASAADPLQRPIDSVSPDPFEQQ